MRRNYWVGMRRSRWGGLLLVTALLISGCPQEEALGRLKLMGYRRLVAMPGAQLYVKPLERPAPMVSNRPAQGTQATLPVGEPQAEGDRVYLQVLDLRQVALEQVVGEVVQPGKGQGIYFRGEGGFPSPFFRNLLFSEVQERVQKQYGDRLFSLINAAFFEQHAPQTQLSFPLKSQGQVLTGGNSPYGPRKTPQDAQFRGITLLALTWGTGWVKLSPYEAATGLPLQDQTGKSVGAEGLVSYDYRDHPAYRYQQQAANRFHVLGTADGDGKAGDELLVIATVERATLDEAAALLRQLGVTSPIMTIDGGTSTYLFTAKTGTLLFPGGTGETSRRLPHYLLIRALNGDQHQAGEKGR